MCLPSCCRVLFGMTALLNTPCVADVRAFAGSHPMRLRKHMRVADSLQLTIHSHNKSQIH